MYYNNTKENKDNKKLKLTNSLMKNNILSQMHIMTFKRINSIGQKYLLRLQNTAEWDDAYTYTENIVNIDIEAVLKGLGLSVCVSRIIIICRWLKKFPCSA